MRPVFIFLVPICLSACSGPVNNPYSASERGKSIYYSAFTERPKHLDPALSYASDEAVFTQQVYEPPLQYHSLKRPYQLEPLTAARCCRVPRGNG